MEIESNKSNKRKLNQMNQIKQKLNQRNGNWIKETEIQTHQHRKGSQQQIWEHWGPSLWIIQNRWLWYLLNHQQFSIRYFPTKTVRRSLGTAQTLISRWTILWACMWARASKTCWMTSLASFSVKVSRSIISSNKSQLLILSHSEGSIKKKHTIQAQETNILGNQRLHIKRQFGDGLAYLQESQPRFWGEFCALLSFWKCILLQPLLLFRYKSPFERLQNYH